MCLLSIQRSMRIERMGRVPYGPMHALQKHRHAEVSAGDSDDTLFLLEHEPVVTFGKNSGRDNLLVGEEALDARGIELFETGRGGDITYHGPGQIVGYPILQLQPEGEQDIKRYVGWLEDIVIRTADDFGVEARRVEGLRGIWVGNDKLAAVGVRIANWTTMHGFALNITTRLEDFSTIIPCGLVGRGVTSFERLLDEVPTIEEVQERLIHHASIVLDRRLFEAEPTVLPTASDAARCSSTPEARL